MIIPSQEQWNKVQKALEPKTRLQPFVGASAHTSKLCNMRLVFPRIQGGFELNEGPTFKPSYLCMIVSNQDNLVSIFHIRLFNKFPISILILAANFNFNFNVKV